MDVVFLMVENIFLKKMDNYLLFRLDFRDFETSTNNMNIAQLKGLSDESIKLPVTTGNSFVPRLDYFNNFELQVESNGNCLKIDRVSCAPKKQ